MTDCATLLVADALGIFAQHGLQVALCREAGWATVREKMLNAELDAAHAPASMVFEMTYGLGVMPVPSHTGLVMALNGNAVTLSNELWELGVRDAPSLKRIIDQHRGKRTFTFAGVLNYSSQHYLMRKWLRSGGIDPDRDVNIAIVPPPLVASCLQNGHLDGFCVAEPWSSLSLLNEQGWCAALTSELDPKHVEKVFMVRSDFDHDREEEHLRLIASLIEAARYCDEPENRREVATILSHERYLDVPRSVLEPALVGPFYMGKDRHAPADDAIIFHREDAGRPTVAKGQWVLDEIRAHGLAKAGAALRLSNIPTVFREDLFDKALSHLKRNQLPTTESRPGKEAAALTLP